MACGIAHEEEDDIWVGEMEEDCRTDEAEHIKAFSHVEIADRCLPMSIIVYIYSKR